MIQLDFFTPSRISSYYNTTGESEEKSRVYEQVARAQDDKIFSKISMGGQWTSEELHEIFPGMLLTSIRRALSNLVRVDGLRWPERRWGSIKGIF